MKTAGLILAAGESSRMGRDKALLDYRGSTFLNHLIRLLLPRVDPLVAVLGHHAESIRQTIDQPTDTAETDLRIVVNEDYQLGMLSSLQTGIRALPTETKAALFTLVDHPAVRAATLDRLLAEFAQAGNPLALPRYQGRQGHPVVASRDVLEELLTLPVTSSAKEVIRGHREATHFVDVEDPGTLRDIDLPAEYETWKASW